MKRKLLVLALTLGAAGAVLATGISSGNLLVIDQTAGTGQQGALFTVNSSGDRTLFSDFGNSAQGALGTDPESVAWLPGGLLGLLPASVLVTDGSSGTNQQGALFTVNPTSGSRTLLSDFGNSAQGPLGEYPVATVVLPGLLGLSYSVAVVDAFAGTNGQGALFTIDSSGNRTQLVDFGDSTGPAGEYPDSAAYLPGLLGLTGTLLVADGSAGTNAQGALFSINPSSGARSILSDFGNTAQGWTDSDPETTPISVLITPSGNIFVLAEDSGTNGAGALVQVNPSTGYRTLISDFGNTAQGATAIGVAPNSIAWSPSLGAIVVSDADAGTGGNGAVFAVNPVTGQRTTFSDFGNTAQGNDVGDEPSGIAVAP